jgi:hypothetical protein
MHMATLNLFILGASLLTHQVAGEQLVPRGCVPSNETVSGLACPAPPGLDNNLTRRKTSFTGFLNQISDPAQMGDDFIWSALGGPYTLVSNPINRLSVLNPNTVTASRRSGS